VERGVSPPTGSPEAVAWSWSDPARRPGRPWRRPLHVAPVCVTTAGAAWTAADGPGAAAC